MSDNGHASNGVGSSGLGGWGDATDMTRGKDREHLRQAISSGWKLSPEMLEKYRVALDEALAIDREKGDSRGVRSCVRTMAAISGQVQADEQLDRKYGRIDSGLATDASTVFGLEFDEGIVDRT